MKGNQEMMKYPEASNCEKPVLQPLGLKGHREMVVPATQKVLEL